MPLPVLQWLADQGLADTSAVEEGIIRLDPKISGVGPNVRLPLARSQHDLAIRLIEMDAASGDRDPVATMTRPGLGAELTRRILWDDAAGLLNLSQQSG